MDNLSVQHHKAVWAEIQGRFFSKEEAEQLKEELDRRVIEDAKLRELAAESWKS